jgi:hypothetical protein
MLDNNNTTKNSVICRMYKTVCPSEYNIALNNYARDHYSEKILEKLFAAGDSKEETSTSINDQNDTDTEYSHDLYESFDMFKDEFWEMQSSDNNNNSDSNDILNDPAIFGHLFDDTVFGDDNNNNNSYVVDGKKICMV